MTGGGVGFGATGAMVDLRIGAFILTSVVDGGGFCCGFLGTSGFLIGLGFTGAGCNTFWGMCGCVFGCWAGFFGYVGLVCVASLCFLRASSFISFSVAATEASRASGGFTGFGGGIEVRAKSMFPALKSGLSGFGTDTLAVDRMTTA